MSLDLDARFQKAIQDYWSARERQQKKQIQGGKIDSGTRGAVTGGTQMGSLEVLIRDILMEAGLDDLEIKTRTALELPGSYRSEKKWDLIVICKGQLLSALEFKSQVRPSFGNNFNNRSEEAIGSATDIWVAFREGRFGSGPAPFLGYFFLLEDCEPVHRPVRNQEPYFPVDPAFVGASYCQRYELLLRRLVRERLYNVCCLTLATNATPTRITHPSDDLSIHRYVATLKSHIFAFKTNSRNRK